MYLPYFHTLSNLNKKKNIIKMKYQIHILVSKTIYSIIDIIRELVTIPLFVREIFTLAAQHRQANN